MICDRCGREIVPLVEARYTIADSDDGATGRHYSCHQADLDRWEEAKRRVPELSAEVGRLLGEIRRRVRKS